MSYPPEQVELIDLTLEKQQLYESARTTVARRAGTTVYRGDGVRQTLVVILAGEEMAEHESPQEGFVHVMEGKVRINGYERAWEIHSGQLLPVPPEKHSVTALEDSILTITVLRKAVMG